MPNNNISPVIIPDFKFQKSYNDCEKTQFLEFIAKNGTLEFDDVDYDVKDVKIQISDDIVFYGICKFNIIKREHCTLTLISDDGWEINITNCVITGQTRPSGEIIGKGLNFTAKNGHVNSSDKVLVHQLIENMEFEDYPIQFNSADLEGLVLFNENIKDFPSSSGYFAFVDTYSSLETKWEEIINNFHFLLGFFSSNFVNLRAKYIYGPKDYKEIRVFPINDSTGSGSSVFRPKMTWETFHFLNSTYDNFVMFKEDLNLPIVLDYYVWMKNSPYVDSHRILLGVILMEALKFAYASKLKKYSKTGSKFFKPVGSSSTRMDFLDLIKDIYSDFNLDILKIHSRYLEREFKRESLMEIKDVFCPGFQINLFKISKDENFTKYLKDYRNEVVHEGNIKLGYPDIKKPMHYVEWSIEILLLKILDVNCNYWDSCDEKWVNSQKLIKKLLI